MSAETGGKKSVQGLVR